MINKLVNKYPLGVSELLDNAFTIQMNANDFFGYACADAVQIDITDLEWILPIVEQFPNDGINAVLSFIRNQMPLEPYQTGYFLLALNEIHAVTEGKTIWSREYCE